MSELPPRLVDFPGENIIDNPVTSEMEDSFIAYALSVITSRALPDIRDGLKPVQRRILFAMWEGGLRPGNPYRKSASAVGDVMKNYHPHGDSSIYDALVRMSQPWAMRVPLIDPQGNFGSLDDGPAAMRYTEARLQPAAMSMLESINEDTVDFAPNYDGYGKEPVVLPSGVPNLLVNGGSGIAVGMACSFAPHNLVEVVDALCMLLENRDASLADVMAYLPGPDFPSGGILMGSGSLVDAYATGRGTFKVRAKTKIEQTSERRRGIVVTELPYMVGPERVIEKVRELVRDKQIDGIASIEDYSDRKNGLKLVVECKNGYDPAAIRDQLFASTPLEETFSINAVALVDGVPRQVSLLEMCSHYLDHRLDVIVRRTRFRLNKAEARAHILEGLIIALANIDEVVEIIKASADTDEARGRLTATFELSEIQADHILEMQLRRLTSMEVKKIEEELEGLRRTIAELTELLASEDKQRALCAEELAETAERFGNDRRTKLTDRESVKPGERNAKIPDSPCLVVLSHTGLISRIDPERGTRDRKVTVDRVIRQASPSTTRSKFLVVTSSGAGHWLDTLELPNASDSVDPVRLDLLVPLEPGEEIVGVVDPNVTTTLAFATRNGTIKRTDLDKLSQRSPTDLVAIDDGDALVGVANGAEGRDFVLVTSDAQLLRTSGDDVRVQGRTAGGVKGMNVNDGERVVVFGTVPTESAKDEALVVLVTEGGVKISDAREFPSKGRGGKGVRCLKFTKDDTAILDGYVGEPVGKPVAVTASNRTKKVPDHRAKRDTGTRRLGTEVAGIGQTIIDE